MKGFWTVSGDETRQRVKFTDERVCKSHLLNCCPHDILSGTVSTRRLLRKLHPTADVRELVMDSVICFVS